VDSSFRGEKGNKKNTLTAELLERGGGKGENSKKIQRERIAGSMGGQGRETAPDHRRNECSPRELKEEGEKPRQRRKIVIFETWGDLV